MERSLRGLVISGAALVVAMAGMWIAQRQGGVRQREAPSELPVVRQVSDFAVTNQAGVGLGLDALRGRPWAVDLIFTRCPGPCETLTRTMREVQKKLPASSDAGLISLTSDPDFDTPEALSRYAERHGAETSNWHFVTGSKAEIRRLATEELLLVLVEKEPGERASENDLFLHSTYVVLLDRAGRLRGAIEGAEPGAADRGVAALRQLEAESQP
jgi:protein SCO1/2